MRRSGECRSGVPRENADLTACVFSPSVTDEEAVAMSRYLVHHDGLFLGSSSACNLIACIRLVKKMGWTNGERVITIL